MRKYEDLLHELEKLHGAYVATGNDNSNTAKLLWACHEAIIELQETKWTKIVDSRPPDNEDVIGYVQFIDESRVTPCNYSKGVWTDVVFDEDVSKNITHWTPRPLPPDPDI